jgi:hypothetical protein
MSFLGVVIRDTMLVVLVSLCRCVEHAPCRVLWFFSINYSRKKNGTKSHLHTDRSIASLKYDPRDPFRHLMTPSESHTSTSGLRWRRPELSPHCGPSHAAGCTAGQPPG